MHIIPDYTQTQTNTESFILLIKCLRQFESRVCVWECCGKRVPLVAHFTWGPTANVRASVRTHILWTFSSSRKLSTWPTYLHRLLKRVLEWGKEKENETVGGGERELRAQGWCSTLRARTDGRGGLGSLRWDATLSFPLSSFQFSISKCFMAWLFYTQYFWRINKRNKNCDISYLI